METQIRNRLVKRIQQIPSEKLKELEKFISKLEATTGKKEKNLSFAGSWSEMDDDLFGEFTENLIEKRQRNKRRPNG